MVFFCLLEIYLTINTNKDIKITLANIITTIIYKSIFIKKKKDINTQKWEHGCSFCCMSI